MKKILLTSAIALLGASAVFAQGYSVVPSDPDWNNTYKDTQNGTVTFTFDESVKLVKDEIMAVGLNGWGFEMNFLQLDFDVVSNDEVNSVVVKVDRTSWGDPALSDSGEMDENGNYVADFHLTVLLQGIYDADGNMIGEDEEWGGPSASYICPNTFDAYFLHTAPSSEYFSAEMAYDNEVIAFCFSNQVTLSSDANAKIKYYYDDEALNPIIVNNLECIQDEYTGVWKVLVPVNNTSITESSMLEEMTITLNGVNSFDEIDAVYESVPSGWNSYAARKKTQQAGTLKLVPVYGVSTVYNVLGNVVKTNATNEEINSLPSGIYIINGVKKIIR